MVTGDAAGGGPRGGRALVVDDEPEIRETLAEILERDGFLVDLAENGQGGLERAQNADYDLVMSDINMPAMDGMKFYLRLRQLRPSLADRFVLVTGNITSTVRLFLDETGLPRIDKPFRPSEVRQAAARAARRRQA